ncbi:NUDIX hydrolase [Phaeobacter sp. QD34_3]|uniref:NUDIX hydrolase n=1 Tax=unclassified Phaeobacter TaxID=2621772 RepID=UPI00237F8A3F|nr:MULTISPECIES: NUDIX hydrolase [unclassified Phaeobacter]MDE4134048.1 NUDIX hydrolase [Phaeobacter sp. QD34_3]MDE4137790.1 NUDIX hydrolase [Phaeobacter sp. QD34_24]MDE4173251.1 NUDIX hydrolase [Phaeobacter sp. PT47_59]
MPRTSGVDPLNQSALSAVSKTQTDTATQVAALCFRITRTGKPRILMITSRGTGRWILPKGWPIPGRSLAQSAAIEAWEEAGARGVPLDQCLGEYAYEKWRRELTPLPCVVRVYPVLVTGLQDNFPEQAERQRAWKSPRKAAALVQEKGLQGILAGFDPLTLGSDLFNS